MKLPDIVNTSKEYSKKSSYQIDTKEVVCYLCGEKGHYSNKCPDKKIKPTARKSEVLLEDNIIPFVKVIQLENSISEKLNNNFVNSNMNFVDSWVKMFLPCQIQKLMLMIMQFNQCQ